MAELTDWAASANGATLASTSHADASGSTPDNVHDAFDDSGSRVKTTGASDAWWTYTITFAHTVVIDRFEVRTSFARDRTTLDRPNGLLEYYDGAWNTIRADANLPSSVTTYKILADAPYVDVSKVRWTVSDIDRTFTLFGGWQYANAYTFFIRAWGRFFDDGAVAGSDLSDGIRIWDGTANINIAMEALDGHKVRVRGSDGVTYGVPLVATTHSSASKVRIYDGTEVKSFVEIT